MGVESKWDELSIYHEKASLLIQEVEDSTPIYISVIVLAEVIYGYEVHEKADPNRRSEMRKRMAAYTPTQILAIDQHTAPIYANLRAKLFKTYSPKDKRGKLKVKHPETLIDDTSGQVLGIDENDLWLAAQAIQRNLILVTRDKMRHIFSVAPELRVRILSI